MERSAAFIPRIPRGERDPILERRERVEGPLQELEKDRAEVAGFNIAFAAVLDGRITDQSQLNALANPLFTREGYLQDASRNYVSIFTSDGRLLNETMLRGVRLSSYDLQLSLRFLAFINNSTLPSEVRENLKSYIRGRDAKVLERLTTILAAAQNEAMSSEVAGIVNDILKSQRIVVFKRDVYSAIFSDRLSEASQLIADFEGEEVSDVQLKAELQDAVAAKKKVQLAQEVCALLASQRRDLNQALEKAGSLVGSSREDERAIGLAFVKEVYAFELAAFKEGLSKFITKNPDPDAIRIFIDGFPIRPSIEGIDYVQTVVATREKAFQSVGEILRVRALDASVKVREGFASQSVDAVLASIDALADDTERDREVKIQLFELYKSYVAANRPDIFDTKFAEEIRRREAEQLEAKFVSPERGRNKEGFNFVRDRFVETIFPLVESLRADGGAAGEKVRSILDSEDLSNNSRRQFEQRLKQFEEQRPLTDVERSYLQSVELMSLFNPYLVACALGDPGVTSEFLRHHFERLSQSTTAQLQDGDYVPLLQIGLGPNGLAALGEGVRNNAALMSEVLVIDAGKQPGGPFAIPEGAAWELNSANRRGSAARRLPDAPGLDEIKTIRSFGSPLRWYPGERSGGKDTRGGSINATVDYLITPDDLSTARYPTNEELQIVLALQAALLTRRVALQTKLINVERDPDPHGPKDEHGDLLRKVVTLEITEPTGTRQIRIKTDAIWGSTGLGEPGYGFKLTGSRAERVMQQTKDAPFPKICTTLEGFNAFAGRSREQVSPGETMVIWGKGNSADTLIEYIGSLFQGDNPRVRDITKVYVICDGNLSARPRYAAISDLKPRNGRGNLIEQVSARVTDADFATNEGDPATRKLLVYGEDGEPIRNNSGEVIVADSAIAATGFRSKFDALFETYAGSVTGENGAVNREPLVLPTNENVPVAETLRGDPTVLILGTASSPEFDKADKLAQLPRSAREALLRNGAENAVAIGFRAPDVQAAVNIWLNSQEVRVEGSPVKNKRQEIEVNAPGGAIPGTTFRLQTVVTGKERIPNNITDVVRALSPLFIYNIGNAIELSRVGGRRFTGELSFALTYDKDQESFGLVYGEENDSPVSKQLVEAVLAACMDVDVQKYALIALRKKRRNPKLDIVLCFKNGFVDPKTTFLQG